MGTNNRVRIPFVCLCALMGSMLAVAAGGRDFAGFFKLSEIDDSADPVHVTLSVRVFNYSSSDVANATVTLVSSAAPNQSFGQFSGVAITSKESVTLSSRFSIPQREYQLWRKGLPPSMMIQFADSAGKNARHRIEVVHGPADGSN